MVHAWRIGVGMVLAALLPVASLAADVTLQSTVVRSGYFETPDCKPEADPAAFNECLCKADIRKAEVIGGVSPSIASEINAVLAKVPEQLARESCDGKPVQPLASKLSINEAGASYQVVHQTPEVLTVLVTYQTYGAGAAHPLGGTEGFTLDLKTGKPIDPTHLLSSADLLKADAYVKQELLKKYADSVFDETKSRLEPFLTENGCDTCTMYYTKDGWNVRFQLYAVAPYVTGEPEILVPTDVIPAAETLIAKR